MVALLNSTNLVEVIIERSVREPNSLAIRSLADGQTPLCVTYELLDQKVRACAGYLQEMSAPGDRAIIFLHSGIDYVVALLA